jgi:magnesium-protoporphyrin IX monomethyl ester (oxidative) cyclase
MRSIGMGRGGARRRQRPKIALLRPPTNEVEGGRGHSLDIPLGLLSIAAVLDARHYDVAVYDCRVEGAGSPARKAHRAGDLLGASWEEIATFIRQSSPDIVGISCQFTAQSEAALHLAEVVKRTDAGILTVMGGAHASAQSTEILGRCRFVDLVVIGEGEYCLLEIAEYVEGKRALSDIKGLAYRSGDTIVRTERRPGIRNLDELPLPAYHLINLEAYFALKKETADTDMARPRFNYPGSERSLSFITSRGCPFNCVFCSIHLHMGKTYRAHSARYVLDHLEYLVNAHGVIHVHFEDDNLTLDRDRFKQILDGIEKRDLRITWDTPNGVRADTLDRGMLQQCKRTGCVYLIVGIESGDQQVLDLIIQKQLSIDTILEVAEGAHEVGIDLRSFFIIGFPGETLAQIRTTLEVALRLHREFRIQPNLMFATPLMGTRLFDICRENGYLAGPVTPASLAVATSRRGMIQTPDFNPDELCDLRDRFNRKTRRYHVMHFVEGLLRSPRLLGYLLANAWMHPRRLRRYCSDTVLFHHFLKSSQRRLRGPRRQATSQRVKRTPQSSHAASNDPA